MSGTPSSELTKKVLAILTALAQRGESGIRLIDAARATQIPRPTVHRIMQELVDGGFVARSEAGTYSLGSAIFELALSAPSPIRDITALRKLTQSLADRCGDTVYVAVRQFDGVNYVVRAEGDYPLQTGVPVGTNRSLANSYAGFALLPFVEAEQRERVIAKRVADLVPEEADAARAVFADLENQVLTRGYCWAADIVLPGVTGLSMPIRSSQGAPYAAIAISTVSARLPYERIESLGRSLMVLERQMRSCFA